MRINPLITSPSPRDLIEFKEGLDTIPCDKLLVKYHHARRAYKIMRSYFLDHEEYTHLILAPDDLIVNKEHYNALKYDIEEQDYPVLSGVCNVDSGRRNHLLACTLKMPTLRRNIGSYNFLKITEANSINNIIKMEWSGFPFMWIRRDIMEEIEFEDDTKWNPQQPNMGWGFDTIFCHHCKESGIPVYVDLKVFMKHYKLDYKIKGSTIRTGVVPPKIIFINNQEEVDITEQCNSKYLTNEDWKPLPHLNSSLRRSQMI